MRQRVAAGETLNDEDIPIVVKHHSLHPLYDVTFGPDGFGHESSQVDYNDFENNYKYFGKFTEANKTLAKSLQEQQED